MDSLSENMKRKYQDIIIRIDEQEHNDQTKAFTWVLDNVRDISDICILGATGEREGKRYKCGNGFRFQHNLRNH